MAEPKCSSKCIHLARCVVCGKKLCSMGIQGKVCDKEKTTILLQQGGEACHDCSKLEIDMM